MFQESGHLNHGVPCVLLLLDKWEGGGSKKNNIIKTKITRKVPGGPAVRNLSFHCRGHRFDPWLGNYDPTCHEARSEKKSAGGVIEAGSWVYGGSLHSSLYS